METELLNSIKAAAEEAGNIMMRASHSRVMQKSGHANFCTETDEKIQRFLVEKLGEILPDAGQEQIEKILR